MAGSFIHFAQRFGGAALDLQGGGRVDTFQRGQWWKEKPMTDNPAMIVAWRRTLAAIGLLAVGCSPAFGQASSLAPMVPPKPGVPLRIDPIIEPLPQAIVPAVAVPKTTSAKAGRTKSTLATANPSNRPICQPGERLQRKVGICLPVASLAPKSLVAKVRPVKSAVTKIASPAKISKPKVPTKKG
jgi:hypothetical protein